MNNLTINRLNAKTQELTPDEYKAIKGGEAATAIATGIKVLQTLKGQQDAQFAPYVQLAAQQFFAPDDVATV